jgi:hypothetical protein
MKINKVYNNKDKDESGIGSSLIRPLYNDKEVEKAVDVRVGELIPQPTPIDLQLVTLADYNQALNEIDSLLTQLEQVTNENTQLTAEVSRLQSEVTSLRSELDGLKNTNTGLQSSLSAIQSQLQTLMNDLTAARTAANTAQSQAFMAQAEKLVAQGRADSLQQTINTLNTQITSLQAALVNAEKPVNVTGGTGGGGGTPPPPTQAPPPSGGGGGGTTPTTTQSGGGLPSTTTTQNPFTTATGVGVDPELLKELEEYFNKVRVPTLRDGRGTPNPDYINPSTFTKEVNIEIDSATDSDIYFSISDFQQNLFEDTYRHVPNVGLVNSLKWRKGLNGESKIKNNPLFPPKFTDTEAGIQAAAQFIINNGGDLGIVRPSLNTLLITNDSSGMGYYLLDNSMDHRIKKYNVIAGTPLKITANFKTGANTTNKHNYDVLVYINGKLAHIYENADHYFAFGPPYIGPVNDNMNIKILVKESQKYTITISENIPNHLKNAFNSIQGMMGGSFSPYQWEIQTYMATYKHFPYEAENLPIATANPPFNDKTTVMGRSNQSLTTSPVTLQSYKGVGMYVIHSHINLDGDKNLHVYWTNNGTPMGYTQSFVGNVTQDQLASGRDTNIDNYTKITLTKIQPYFEFYPVMGSYRLFNFAKGSRIGINDINNPITHIDDEPNYCYITGLNESLCIPIENCSTPFLFLEDVMTIKSTPCGFDDINIGAIKVTRPYTKPYNVRNGFPWGTPINGSPTNIVPITFDEGYNLQSGNGIGIGNTISQLTIGENMNLVLVAKDVFDYNDVGCKIELLSSQNTLIDTVYAENGRPTYIESRKTSGMYEKSFLDTHKLKFILNSPHTDHIKYVRLYLVGSGTAQDVIVYRWDEYGTPLTYTPDGRPLTWQTEFKDFDNEFEISIKNLPNIGFTVPNNLIFRYEFRYIDGRYGSGTARMDFINQPTLTPGNYKEYKISNGFNTYAEAGAATTFPISVYGPSQFSVLLAFPFHTSAAGTERYNGNNKWYKAESFQSLVFQLFSNGEAGQFYNTDLLPPVVTVSTPNVPVSSGFSVNWTTVQTATKYEWEIYRRTSANNAQFFTADRLLSGETTTTSVSFPQSTTQTLTNSGDEFYIRVRALLPFDGTPYNLENVNTVYTDWSPNTTMANFLIN